MSAFLAVLSLEEGVDPSPLVGPGRTTPNIGDARVNRWSYQQRQKQQSEYGQRKRRRVPSYLGYEPESSYIRLGIYTTTKSVLG